jgi:uncharacterized lipoprotein YehR (DUF1307 family)
MIKVSTKGKTKHVTSSYFDDMRLMKKSEFETDYRDIKRNTKFDAIKLKAAYAVQKIILWRKGCIELNQWVSTQNNSQLQNVTTDYLGEDYYEWDGPVDLDFLQASS